MKSRTATLAVGILLLVALVVVAEADTDAGDVAALGNLYSSWNSPAQLTGWSASGGDPCGAAWAGVSCSGSAVTSIKLSGMELNGTLGYQLSSLQALKTMDLSNNHLHDSIPYQLPSNLTYLNLAKNNFSGNLPYSISNLVSLEYLNLSHNSLFQEIGELFGSLNSLSELDVSFNNLTGNLPFSMGALSKLSSLYMQNNQLSGTVDVLSNISLATLNIADNNFSGMIPQEFSSIPNLIVGGNSFVNMPASPPSTLKPPLEEPQGPVSAPTSPDTPIDQDDRKIQTGPLIGIAVGSIAAASCVLFVLVFCLHNARRRNDDEISEPKDLVGSLAVSIETASSREVLNNNHENSAVATSDLQHAGKMMMTPDRVLHDTTNGSSTAKRPKVPVTVTSYTVADLQVATNSFCEDSLLGEGSLGRVYKAGFPNGKVLAVKKVDDSALLSLYGGGEDAFLELVSNVSRLRHPNIVPLTGYCVEHGQRLLVYEYVGNGTLRDVLQHCLSDDEGASKKLTWNTRVRIALGTARALEYLHEVCIPPVVHSRTFKASNILLDEEYSPHLSDCGLAALTTVVSPEAVGSFGYSAPELAMSGTYTAKSDVYSFGVVMLELLTGRKPLDSVCVCVCLPYQLQREVRTVSREMGSPAAPRHRSPRQDGRSGAGRAVPFQVPLPFRRHHRHLRPAGAGVPPADVRGRAAAGAPDAEGGHHKAAIGRSGLLVQGPRPRRRRSSRRRPLTLRG
ncbi:protein STRUBBELIG-RECEPTOR FAMILY 8 isoform X4 [Zea mays]|uniref:protein STRUBBELIG-RECEPTOR FAMILY 8 isoform X4 n=1 Tax=Zea mays TaxID=4577 RepID=UPI0004DE95C8|nr:protein STRUBBELIG-RECEPTOR FAMILY 8 isoform X4 [Zea mays]|eukprot:XP_008649052.1 protein STRUBBELIG-RECEPTOR FAMILY 8 isoform X2 [Zea mays]